MWKQLKQDLSHFRASPAGERFSRHRRRVRSRRAEHPLATGGYILFGLVVVVTGMLLSIPPGVPGFLVTLLGLGILAARSDGVARVLDRLEMTVRRWRG